MVCIDVESTGPKPETDRIVQIALVAGDREWSSLVNPGVPIPAEATQVHGITDAQVATAPTFAQLAATILDWVGGSAPLVGFRLRHFDVPLLAEEFERCDIHWEPGPIIDVGQIFTLCRPRKLADAVQLYLGRPHEGAHDALADARVTLQILERQRATEPLLAGVAVEDLAAIGAKNNADPFGRLLWINGVLCFGTRRQNGVPVARDLGYANWFLKNDFPLSTKRMISVELERIKRLRK